MSDTSLSQAIKEAYASAPTSELILHTLEFRHPSFVDDYGVPTALRVVRDHNNLTATLEAGAPLDASTPVYFIGYAFDFQLPSVEQSAVPEIVITIDNVSREIEANLERAVLSPSKVEVTYRPYLASDLSQPQMNPPLTLTVTAIEASDLTVTCRATFGDLANKRFPNVDYTPTLFPGLVR
jgi:hypothetical protein